MLANARPVLKLGVLSFLACIGSATSSGANQGAELAKLQGTWQLVEMHTNGKKDTERAKSYRWTFNDDQYTVFRNDKKVEAWTAKLGDRTIDATLNIGPKTNGITLRGIYELSGDTLKICYDRTGEGRPDDFKTAADSYRVLYVLKRQ
jgi:uncharacterized protein (TIGR03067 family)